MHTNLNIPSNLYCAKYDAFYSNKQSQQPHFMFGNTTSTSSTQLKSSFSFMEREKNLEKRGIVVGNSFSQNRNATN